MSLGEEDRLPQAILAQRQAARERNLVEGKRRAAQEPYRLALEFQGLDSELRHPAAILPRQQHHQNHS